MGAQKQAGKTGRPARVPGEKHTKEKIFDAAVDLFAKKGYDRTSIRDIAKAVGIAESAVYRHYTSKEAILDAIFDYMETQIYAPLPPAPNAEKRPESSIFRDMLAGLPWFIEANPIMVKIAHIMFTEMYHNDRIRDYFRKEYIERGDSTTEAIFREQVEAGKIKPCNVRALAGLFNAYRFAWVFQSFVFDYGRPIDMDAIKRDLEAQIELFEDLLKPESS